MAAVLVRRAERSSGLRPLDPSRDLRGVAKLIEEAFAYDLDRTGRSALRELQAWSRLGPVLWWLEKIGGDFSDLLSGFVWEEAGQIVGNITVNRIAPGSQRWLISNVAVARSHRGRGIARVLMDAALGYVEECQGDVVSLQVRADNAPARHIYHSLGFKDVSGLTYLRLDRVPPVAWLPLPPGLIARPHRYNKKDSRRAYELARAARSAKAQEHRPLRQRQFQLGLEDHIDGFFRRLVGGGPSRHTVVENEDGSLVATLSVKPGTWRREHHLNLVVHPEYWGRLEHPLISQGLIYLGNWPQRAIAFEHPAEHVAGVDAFKSFGFNEIWTHVWMKLDLQRPDAG
ncbi:MAG: GNAT family N-acetyltransferase [Anaerolineae bacterium]